LAVVEVCIDKDFSCFLDKKQYIPHGSELNPNQIVCGHYKYGYSYFVHKKYFLKITITIAGQLKDSKNL
jgi:hypothetical protein